MGSKLHDLTGMRFGHWYVRERDTTEHFHPTRWICVCDCGTVQSISLPALRHGSSSCRKCADGVVRNPNFLRKHSNRLYHTWSEMRRRCAGKCTNSVYYKEKGIYKYTYGASADYNKVLRTKRSITAQFKDAFIIAFRNGEKMNVNEAITEFKKRKNK